MRYSRTGVDGERWIAATGSQLENSRRLRTWKRDILRGSLQQEERVESVQRRTVTDVATLGLCLSATTDIHDTLSFAHPRNGDRDNRGGRTGGGRRG